MQLKSGHKRTDLGIFPEDWDIKYLSTVAEKIMVGIASAATHAYRNKGIPLFRNQNIKSGYLDDSDLLFISPEYEMGFRNKRLCSGDLITMRTGYPGVTAIVPIQYHGAQSFTTLITRPKETEVHSNYLCHYINSSFGQNFFNQSQIGGAQKNVNAATLRKMLFPSPALTEQQAIATALSDIDALIDGLSKLITKKRNIKQAAMQQLLTGKTRLPGFSGKWKETVLGEIAKIQRGASPRPIDNPIWFTENSSVGWVRISDVTKANMFLLETTQQLSPLGVKNSRPVASGSLIMSICATVGRPIISKIDVCIHDGFVVFDLLKADQLFIYYILKWIEPNWSEQGQTGSQMNLNTALINNTKIKLPPSDEQTAIAQVLSDMNNEIDALEKRLEKTRMLKQGMMQELLTGRIRLV